MADKKELLKTLKSFFGFNAFKGQQDQIILNILQGLDAFVIMPTGGGKSLCYQLPAIMSEGTAIVVSPLIALMKNQVDAIRGFSQEQGIAHFLNSSLAKAEIIQVKKDVRAGKTKLLYVAPETLTKEDNIAFFKEFKKTLFINLSDSIPEPFNSFNCLISSSKKVLAPAVCFFLQSTKLSN